MSANSVYYAFSGVLSTDRPWIETNATIFQLFHDGRQSPVGSIHDKCSLMDYRDTHICCFGKEESFYANYDTEFLFHSESSFHLGNNNPPVKHHRFWMSGQHYLEYLGHLYPIAISVFRDKERCELAVYDSTYSFADGKISSPLIGEIIIRRKQNRYACNIRIDKELPEEMYMAIISLPFTDNILTGLLFR